MKHVAELALYFLENAKTNTRVAAKGLTDNGETGEAAMSVLAAMDALDKAITAVKLRAEATRTTI